MNINDDKNNISNNKSCNQNNKLINSNNNNNNNKPKIVIQIEENVDTTPSTPSTITTLNEINCDNEQPKKTIAETTPINLQPTALRSSASSSSGNFLTIGSGFKPVTSTSASKQHDDRQRRPSIFDFVSEEDSTFDSENELLVHTIKPDRYDMSADSMSDNGNMSASQYALSKYSNINDRTDLIESQMEVENELTSQQTRESSSSSSSLGIRRNSRLPQSSASNTTYNEKRVEFNIAPSKLPANSKVPPANASFGKSSLAQPKSALKRTNIDTSSLMSQNVDENEEYELIDKEKKKHEPRVSSSIIIADNIDSILHTSTQLNEDTNSDFHFSSTNNANNDVTSEKNSATSNYNNLNNNNNNNNSNNHLKIKRNLGLDRNNNDSTSLINPSQINQFNIEGFNNEKQMLNNQSNEQFSAKNEPFLPATSATQGPDIYVDGVGSNKHTSSGKKPHKNEHKKLKNFLKTKESSVQTHEIYVGLEKLCLVEEENTFSVEPSYEWREISRWIKYEQTVDPETNIWNKPSIGALVYQSLLYLRTGLQYGTVLLKCEQDNFAGIVDDMIHDFIDSGHMNKENRELIKRTLLNNHKRNNTFNMSGLTRKKSTISEFFPIGSRRQSTFTAEPGMFNSENASTSTSRKNSSIQFGEFNIDKSKKQSISDFNLQNKYQNQYQKNQQPSQQQQQMPHTRENSVKFFVASNVGSENSSTNENNTNYNPHKRRRSTIALLKNTIAQKTLNKSDLSIKGVSPDAEAFLIYIGVVDYLDRPVMGFVRLVNSQIMEDICDSQIKVRFIFVLLGPKNDTIDYVEIGRCVGTLMTNKEFHECAYKATDRRDLIEGITQFSNRSLCIILPLGEFDDDLLAPLIEWIKNKLKHKLDKYKNEARSKSSAGREQSPTKKRKSISYAKDKLIENQNNMSAVDSNLIEEHGKSGKGGKGGKRDGEDDQDGDDDDDEDDDDGEFDPFKRTGHIFGSLINEIKYRYSKYFSDFKDALNVHCLIAFVFIFTVCIVPALSFGGILADKTKDWFGVNQMLIATSMNGIISGLFSGQPLMIMGPTGPFLVFEEMLYLFCKVVCIEFLAVRCWVAIWVLIITLIILASENIYIIKYVTRFTEEIFAFLIASVFLTDAVRKIINIFNYDPVYTRDRYCNITTISSFYSIQTNLSVSPAENKKVCAIFDEDLEPPDTHIPDPNIALLSLILLIGTCCMALSLKKLRRSIFLGAVARRTLSDVGMLISIVLMVIVDTVIRSQTGLETPKLDIPDSGLLSNRHRNQLLVSPFGANIELFPIWVPFAALFPALLIFIVLFFEVELTGMILYAKHRKLKKGTGFNLDLLIAALLMNLNSLFGLPWMCAAPVRTLAHWASLCVYSKTYIPGEKPKLIDVKEQRLTNICVHIMIGLCLLARPLLEMIPISVLFGIFLYFGIVSLSGTQLYERIKLIFIPSKYCPNVSYARGVRPSKRNLFTFIQLLFILILLSMKSFNQVSYVFPVVLLFLVPLRTYILPKIFSSKELEQLDSADEMTTDNDSALDFYEITHLPI